MTLLLAALLAFQQPTLKDEIIRLAKAGASEEFLLAKAATVRAKISVDDIVDLKKAGVPEKVIARMIEGPSDAVAFNLAHKAVSVRVIGSEIHIGSEGTAIARGAAVSLPLSGDYHVWVNGRETPCRVKTPAVLTFRGSIHPEFEVVTLYIEDARGTDTCRIEGRVKE